MAYKDELVNMKIEDTGIGIEYKDQQHIFDIFQQDSSDKMINPS